jgi:3-oxoacyl-(acyl-carrier-protein) synthase
MRRAVITGLGIVSPIGVDAFCQAALEERSGLGPPTSFDASKLPRECQVVGEVRDFSPGGSMPGDSYRTVARFSQFAHRGNRRMPPSSQDGDQGVSRIATAPATGS